MHGAGRGWIVLGVQPIVDFEEKSVKLSSGDTLLLYTDGVIDAQNARVSSLARSLAHRSTLIERCRRGADQTLACGGARFLRRRALATTSPSSRCKSMKDRAATGRS